MSDLPESLRPVVDYLEAEFTKLLPDWSGPGDNEAVKRLRGSVVIWRTGCYALQREYDKLKAERDRLLFGVEEKP